MLLANEDNVRQVKGHTLVESMRAYSASVFDRVPRGAVIMTLAPTDANLSCFAVHIRRLAAARGAKNKIGEKTQ